MIALTLDEIVTITGGACDLIDDPGQKVTGSVEFDSRALTPGGLFVALPGLRVDGHDFAAQAVADGAVAALAARPVGAPAIIAPPVEQPDSNAEAFENDPTGATASVLHAMSALARYVAVTLTERGLTIVGVTGSAGKTSTKDMMATVFGSEGPTVAPPGSFNNEIGHPYTVLKCDEDTRFLVAELSARGVGHVAHLAHIAPPHIGVVLNVGTAHLGEFGGRDVIAQAKGELVEALPSAADGGVAVLNADDELVAAMAHRTQAKVVMFSAAMTPEQARSRGVDYVATDIRTDDYARARFILHAGDRQAEVTLQVAGEHQVSNALAAAAAGIEAGLAFEQVVAALSGHQAASANRMDIRDTKSGVTIINDSYNANPDSMRAGMSAMVRIAEARGGAPMIAVLGQMGELGEASTEEHEHLADALAERGINTVVVVGSGVHAAALAARAAELGINTATADNAGAAVNVVDSYLRAIAEQDAAAQPVVLVKASYAEKLWQVAEGLLA